MKTIVITGGSDGLSKTLAKTFAKENNVIILATNEEKMNLVAKENNCFYKVCDVGNYERVEKTISEIVEEYNKIDVLINNEGVLILLEM